VSARYTCNACQTSQKAQSYKGFILSLSPKSVNRVESIHCQVTAGFVEFACKSMYHTRCVCELVANFRIFVITCPRKIISSSVLLELWPELVGLRPRLWPDLPGIPSVNKMKIGDGEIWKTFQCPFPPLNVIVKYEYVYVRRGTGDSDRNVDGRSLRASYEGIGTRSVNGCWQADFTSLVRRSKFRSLYARFRENTPFR